MVSHETELSLITGFLMLIFSLGFNLSSYRFLTYAIVNSLLIATSAACAVKISFIFLEGTGVSFIPVQTQIIKHFEENQK